MIREKYPQLWERVNKISKTCPIHATEDGCLTFAKNRECLKLLLNVKYKVDVITPVWNSVEMPPNIIVHKVTDNIKNIFIEMHNYINYCNAPANNIISPKAIIHKTAVIGVPGNNTMKRSDGRIINIKHMGNVIIEDYAEVQALSVVHRAVFTSTIIRKNAQIFAKVNIGHNCNIGESTIICPGTMLAGGTKIGKNCYIWQGVITRSNISICDNVIIGAGSIVLKDINDPGVYFGSPAKYIKPYNEDLR